MLIFFWKKIRSQTYVTQNDIPITLILVFSLGADLTDVMSLFHPLTCSLTLMCSPCITLLQSNGKAEEPLIFSWLHYFNTYTGVWISTLTSNMLASQAPSTSSKTHQNCEHKVLLTSSAACELLGSRLFRHNSTPSTNMQATQACILLHTFTANCL